MKILKRIIIALGILYLVTLILLSVGFFVIKHLRIKELLESQIEKSMGINVTIKEVVFSPLLAHVGLKGVTIHNPAGFVDDELAYIDYIHFVFDPVEMLTSKKPNIYLFGLDLKRLNIIKNKDGLINVKELTPIKGDAIPKKQEAPFYFDVVVLSVGEVNYADYSGSSEKKRRYIIALKDEVLFGLKDEDVVVKMVLYKALQNTDIGKIINLTITPVVSQLHDTMVSSWGTVKVGTRGIWEIGTLPWKLLFQDHN